MRWLQARAIVLADPDPADPLRDPTYLDAIDPRRDRYADPVDPHRDPITVQPLD